MCAVRNPAHEGELADVRAMSQAMKENTAYNDERKVRKKLSPWMFPDSQNVPQMFTKCALNVH